MKPITTPFPSILTNSVLSWRGAYTRLSTLDPATKAAVITELLLTLERKKAEAFERDFAGFAHDYQRPPERANSGADWTTWLILGGRGAGKTRAGAEWVRGIAATDKNARIALIGETEHEVRSVMVEGVSGLLAVHRDDERPAWSPTQRRLQWKSGAVAEIFSAENHEGLRGPQFSAAWMDELAKWRQGPPTRLAPNCRNGRSLSSRPISVAARSRRWRGFYRVSEPARLAPAGPAATLFMFHGECAYGHLRRRFLPLFLPRLSADADPGSDRS